MRHGSDTPLASITTASKGVADSSTRISARDRSSPIWQHTQPLVSAMVSPLAAAIRPASMLSAPKSLTSTAMRRPSRLAQPVVEQGGLAGAEEAADDA